MAKKNTTSQKTYTVIGRVGVDVSIELTASSIEDAVTKAKELKLENFVSYVGEYQDNECVEIRSLWDNEE
jgi:hypothetical protein